MDLDGEPPYVEVREVTVRRGTRTLLDGVTLAVSPGDVVEIGGPNGCGKTTLLRAMAGLHPLRGGHATRRGPRTWTPVSLDQPIDLSVRAYLHRMATITGSAGPTPAGRVADLIDGLGLAGVTDAPVRTLSTGWRRRVALAAGLVPTRSLAIIDEPFAGLDPEAERIARSVLHDHAQRGGAVLTATPDAAVEADGRVRQLTITAGRLVARPRHDPAHPRLEVVVVLTRSNHAADALPDGPWVVTGDGDAVQVGVPADHVDELLRTALDRGWSVRAVRPEAGP